MGAMFDAIVEKVKDSDRLIIIDYIQLLQGSGKYFSVGGNVKGMLERPGGDVFDAT